MLPCRDDEITERLDSFNFEPLRFLLTISTYIPLKPSLIWLFLIKNILVSSDCVLNLTNPSQTHERINRVSLVLSRISNNNTFNFIAQKIQSQSYSKRKILTVDPCQQSSLRLSFADSLRFHKYVVCGSHMP